MIRITTAGRLEKVRRLSLPSSVLDATEAVRLAARVRALYASSTRKGVDEALELGRVLLDGKAQVKGQYQEWVRQRCELHTRAAANYTALAALAAESPFIVERWKQLGTSKLYGLSRIRAAARRDILRTPGILRMTHREFARLLSPHMRKAYCVTANVRAHAIYTRLSTLAALVDGFHPSRCLTSQARVRLQGQLRWTCRVFWAKARAL